MPSWIVLLFSLSCPLCLVPTFHAGASLGVSVKVPSLGGRSQEGGEQLYLCNETPLSSSSAEL